MVDTLLRLKAEEADDLVVISTCLQDAIARYEIIVSRGGWPRLPKTRTLVVGSSGKIVQLLRQRLAAEGYLPRGAAQGKKYSVSVEEAVRQT